MKKENYKIILAISFYDNIRKSRLAFFQIVKVAQDWNITMKMLREMTLRFLAEPCEVNFSGKVHENTVMKWIYPVGYAIQDVIGLWVERSLFVVR